VGSPIFQNAVRKSSKGNKIQMPNWRLGPEGGGEGIRGQRAGRLSLHRMKRKEGKKNGKRKRRRKGEGEKREKRGRKKREGRKEGKREGGGKREEGEGGGRVKIGGKREGDKGRGEGGWIMQEGEEVGKGGEVSPLSFSIGGGWNGEAIDLNHS